MKTSLDPTHICIDLDTYRTNLRRIQAHVGQSISLMALMKANAYGHGAQPLAKVAEEEGVRYLGVARVAEGVVLREAGITAPILILYYAKPDAYQLAASHRLTPTLNDVESALYYSQAAQAMGKTLPFHVMTDTGMGTFGLLPSEVLPFLHALAQLPNIFLEGIFTHFATADAADRSFAQTQLDRFNAVIQTLESDGIRPHLIHAANSPAILAHSSAHFNMVRPGIVSFGLAASDEFALIDGIEPILTFQSTVARIREFPVGAGVGYGQTYRMSKPTRVALIPVGYGDGYHRLISNRGAVLIGGQRAPIIGRISMDQLTVDVSHIPQVSLHDEVILIGRQGDEEISAEEVASWAETINYEVTTSLLPRVPRIYE